MSFRQYFGVNY